MMWARKYGICILFSLFFCRRRWNLYSLKDNLWLNLLQLTCRIYPHNKSGLFHNSDRWNKVEFLFVNKSFEYWYKEKWFTNKYVTSHNPEIFLIICFPGSWEHACFFFLSLVNKTLTCSAHKSMFLYNITYYINEYYWNHSILLIYRVVNL